MDLTGHSYGQWVVLSYRGVVQYDGSRSQQQVWLCRCACGREVDVQAVALRTGSSKQCRDCHQELHGMTDHPLYGAWLTMRNRCSNPNHPDYEYYGERGISVCERWDSFPLFVQDVGKRPYGRTLDRMDNDGDYEPGNVRWATSAEQVANRRRWGTSRRRWKKPLL